MLSQNVNRRDLEMDRQQMKGTMTTMASQPGLPSTPDAVSGTE